MSKYIYLLIILIFMVPMIISADSTTNFTEKQVLNRVFDHTTDTLKTNIGGAGGVVTVSFDGTQPVSFEGTLDIGTLEVGTVSVDNFPTVQTVDFDGAQPVSGTVAVSNLPATQPVSGTFYPVTQPISIAADVPVTGTFFQTTQPVSGSVDINNYPASQTVDGVFFQATQPISGTVAISNYPATQNIKEVGTWGDELQKPAGFTGAMTVSFSNTIEEATITNLSSTVTLYYSPVSPASNGSFAIQPLQTFSFKCGKTDFYLYFPSTGTCQLHGSYRN